jgi:hypothetical protein
METNQVIEEYQWIELTSDEEWHPYADDFEENGRRCKEKLDICTIHMITPERI